MIRKIINILQKNRNQSSKQGAQHLRARKSAQHLRFSQRAQRGQVLIIVVFAIVGLVAFVGLVVDTGLVFIGNGKLRRAVDAAALAAAAEYRKDPTTTELSKAAKEFLTLNDISQATADVHLICDPTDSMYDNSPNGQCHPANRRLVYVYATSTINLAFLPVIGIRTVTLSANATSEAASLDIVLLMDVSESMTWSYVNSAHESTNILADPVECNQTLAAGDYTNCQPFSDIQHAAVQFVNDRFPDDGSNQFDRVSVIPFDRKAHTDISDPYDAPLHLGVNYDNHLTSAQYKQKIVDTIKGLRVYTASGTVATGGPLSDGSCLDSTGARTFPTGQAPCRTYPYDGDGYCLTTDNKPLSKEDTPPTDDTLADLTCFTPDPTGPYSSLDGTQHYERAYDLMGCPPGVPNANCGTTDTGDAFRAAGQEFVLTPGFRQQSLWIVIMLTDGVANHAEGNAYCPNSDGATCQDNIVATVSNGATGRHCLTSTDPLYTNVGSGILYNACHSNTPNGGAGTVNASAYDADDYARDMADFVALGQNALIYTIGFGNAVTTPNNSGQQLLNYAADIGDDALLDTPAGQLNSDYFFAPDAAALQGIFTTINDRIATRITQ